MVNVRASVCIFPSFATPTWQGNSQSSDLKGGRNRKRGRGEGEIEGLSKSRTGNRVRWTETGKQTSYKKLYTQFRLQKLSCKVTDIFDPEEHHLYKLDRTAASTYGQCDLALNAHTQSHIRARTQLVTHSESLHWTLMCSTKPFISLICSLVLPPGTRPFLKPSPLLD